jgi:hypothetical protein
MNSRERMLATLNFEIPDRVPFCDSYWNEAIEEWQEQGMPKGSSAFDLFDVEWRHLFLDTTFRLPELVTEDSLEQKIIRHGDGMTARYIKGHTSTPGFQDWLVKTKDDWDEHKSRLVPDRSRLSVTNLFAFTDSYVPPVMEWQ